MYMYYNTLFILSLSLHHSLPLSFSQDHEENVSNDFIIRQLTAECQGVSIIPSYKHIHVIHVHVFLKEKQVIRQFHYTAWPDHGRPDSATPIIRMIEMFREHRKRHDIPFAIHCSAGCGRTGTIIAIDFARTMLMTKVGHWKLNFNINYMYMYMYIRFSTCVYIVMMSACFISQFSLSSHCVFYII